MFFGSRDVFKYFLCEKCESLSLEKEPDNLSSYYDLFQSFLMKTHAISFFKRNLLKCSFWLDFNILNKLSKMCLNSYGELPLKALIGKEIALKSKILDVGCGSGTFLKNLQDIGFNDLLGIDPYLNKETTTPGLILEKKSFLEIDAKFDLITFNHSFEHFADPQNIVQHISKTLKERGDLIIRIPNIESFSFKKFHESWEGIHAPFHFFLPSRKGIEKMFSSKGLSILDIQYEQLTHLFLNSQAYEYDIPALK